MPSAFCYFPDTRRYLLGFSRQDETLIGRKLLNDKINKPRLSLNFDSKFVRVWKVESGEKVCLDDDVVPPSIFYEGSPKNSRELVSFVPLIFINCISNAPIDYTCAEVKSSRGCPGKDSSTPDWLTLIRFMRSRMWNYLKLLLFSRARNSRTKSSRERRNHNRCIEVHKMLTYKNSGKTNFYTKIFFIISGKCHLWCMRARVDGKARQKVRQERREAIANPLHNFPNISQSV